MNRSNGTSALGYAALEVDVDRLVDGELAGDERRVLLLRLETVTDGWRHCALAFLRAQCWREAMAPLAMPTATQPPRIRASRGIHWRRAARLSAVAAVLIFGFALGWASRPTSYPSLAEVASFGPDNPATAPRDQLQPSESHLLATAEPIVDSAPLAAALVPAVKSWEQRGYLAETQTRRGSFKLSDGREVQVPVHEVRLKYVRNRTY
jgi:hypothetical protein